MPIHRRSSGSLSPRLIQFKRRESIDNIINEEKNHEHEVNDVNNLNCKVEDLLGMIFFYFLSPYKISDSNWLFSDRNKKIPNTVTPSNSPNRRSIGKQVCNYSLRAFFVEKQLNLLLVLYSEQKLSLFFSDSIISSSSITLNVHFFNFNR